MDQMSSETRTRYQSLVDGMSMFIEENQIGPQPPNMTEILSSSNANENIQRLFNYIRQHRQNGRQEQRAPSDHQHFPGTGSISIIFSAEEDGASNDAEPMDQTGSSIPVMFFGGGSSNGSSADPITITASSALPRSGAAAGQTSSSVTTAASISTNTAPSTSTYSASPHPNMQTFLSGFVQCLSIVYTINV
jgi:hypothetical protein